jgi:ribosomal protein L3 glutamine methyltransferase
MSVRVGEAVRGSAERLDAAGVAFGHGTTNAGQEAMWLAAHVLGLDWQALVRALDDPMPAAAAAALRKLTERRISTRKPAAYLLKEAWLGAHRFYVDERVIVPRSFIFELLEHRRSREGGSPAKGALHPRLDPRLRGDDARILDLCTGSGCLAILAALAWPQAKVDAADISADALAVARRNVDDYGLGDRVSLVRSDLFSGLAGRTYDLIVSNPPYVKAASMKRLPEEYRREPALALASGADGLDHVRVILRKSHAHLKRGGLLVVEVGHNRKALEKAFPGLPFEWPRTSGGRNFVFTLPREALPR